MSAWVLRGLRDGVVTTRWPARPDGYAGSWRGPATVRAGAGGPDAAGPDAAGPDAGGPDAAGPDAGGPDAGGPDAGDPEVALLCPTGAIKAGRPPLVDQGGCILCGRCVAARPDLFGWSAGATGPGAAALVRRALVVPAASETGEAVAAARAALAARTAALRRSVHIRHVDAGSDGSAEWEIQALLGPVYDVHRLGVFFTASPRHADVLLVTGAGTPGMAGPLRETYQGMPDPKVVVAVGTDAISGGLLARDPAGAGIPDGTENPDGWDGPGVTGGGPEALRGVAAHVPVDIWVPGDPPSPFGILAGLLAAVGRLR